MTSKILQIIPVHTKMLAIYPTPEEREECCPIIGLALVEDDGQIRLQYIEHSFDGTPRLTPPNTRFKYNLIGY